MNAEPKWCADSCLVRASNGSFTAPISCRASPPMRYPANCRCLRSGQEQLGIDPGAIETQAPVQMRSGRAAGHADGADTRPRRQALAGLHVDGTQVAVPADEAAAMIDEHGVAVEEIPAREIGRASW